MFDARIKEIGNRGNGIGVRRNLTGLVTGTSLLL